LIKEIFKTSLILLVAFYSNAVAQLRMPAIISDHMVLQADANDPIWGWAQPNEPVTVKIDGQIHICRSDATGKWMVKLDPIPSSNQPLEMIIFVAGGKIVIRDILVGQVWLASGQSNMEMPLTQVNNSQYEIAHADFPAMRFFKIRRAVSGIPLSDFSDSDYKMGPDITSPADDSYGKWRICSPQTVAAGPLGFSAAAYFFGRKLHNDINEPVGLIDSSFDGSPADSWTPLETLTSDPELSPVTQQYQAAMNAFPAQHTAWEIEIKKWELIAARTGKNHISLPARPPEPYFGHQNSRYRPAGLYNAMINPLVPFRIKGVIWYQGEINVSRPFQYRKLLGSLIRSWRNKWNQDNFPFFFVQLARFSKTWVAPDSWAQLREAQLLTLQDVPNAAMAVTIDIPGDANNIHPVNKQEVGRRLALIALARSYNRNIEYSGPIYKSMKIEPGRIIIDFDHTDSGLTSKGEELRGFTIAGADQKFVAAQARILTQQNCGSIPISKIIVWSPAVELPIAVRYAWSDNPEGANLYNNSGLPASPFRTDNWPCGTESLNLM
jgi:sialate O-acetylesterase